MTRGEPAGRFCLHLATGEWTWDDASYRLHGYDPGTVVPSTEIVSHCKDPQDQAELVGLLDRVARTAEDFALAYALVGGDGMERRLIIVGEGRCEVSGDVEAIEGHFIDVTAEFGEASADAVRAAVASATEARATIEQAKGVLMLVYGLDSDAAFAMLRWWSRTHNIKVRDLSRLLVQHVSAGLASTAGLRTRLDSVLHDLAT